MQKDFKLHDIYKMTSACNDERANGKIDLFKKEKQYQKFYRHNLTLKPQKLDLKRVNWLMRNVTIKNQCPVQKIP